MSADTARRQRPGFEPCANDDWQDETSTFVTWGHLVEPDMEDYRDLMRAISHECGMGGLDAIARTARWHTGYVGEVDGHYDLVACDEDGHTGRYGEADELIARKVRPVTWVTVDA